LHFDSPSLVLVEQSSVLCLHFRDFRVVASHTYPEGQHWVFPGVNVDLPNEHPKLSSKVFKRLRLRVQKFRPSFEQEFAASPSSPRLHPATENSERVEDSWAVVVVTMEMARSIRNSVRVVRLIWDWKVREVYKFWVGYEEVINLDFYDPY
jgi:hypothetical protein